MSALVHCTLSYCGDARVPAGPLLGVKCQHLLAPCLNQALVQSTSQQRLLPSMPADPEPGTVCREGPVSWVPHQTLKFVAKMLKFAAALRRGSELKIPPLLSPTAARGSWPAPLADTLLLWSGGGGLRWLPAGQSTVCALACVSQPPAPQTLARAAGNTVLVLVAGGSPWASGLSQTGIIGFSATCAVLARPAKLQPACA